MTHLTQSPREAAAALVDGYLAVLPTETVYGLGALADGTGVGRIFEVKGRPEWHPLIVHVSSAAALGGADAWARDVPAFARALVKAFWPGPLTIVVPRSTRVTDAITGGQDTVALRSPAHPLTREVLRKLDITTRSHAGVAAPSANRHGAVSPTTANHVARDLGAYLSPRDVILDGGVCDVGVESTIVDCTGVAPRILRPGSIGIPDIEHVTGLHVSDEASDVRAPGGLAAHYAPNARVRLINESELGNVDAGVGLIAMSNVATPAHVVRLLSANDVQAYAHNLYAALRDADQQGVTDVVAIAPEGNTGLADAIRDRLTRAAAS
ncbi:unannotated protein [freshwater metagenome]|uniref:Threonylcarbamoyl-AMP synthase n=1 Tax=freshwater metagenome TaxID=449393 RepID=A0A6J7HDX4_9ZZZZ|nr:threonylcarbamoyl-AMP synthase [Actinomycetota bacterium]